LEWRSVERNGESKKCYLGFLLFDHPFLSFPLKGKGLSTQAHIFASLPLQGEGKEGVIKNKFPSKNQHN